MRREKEMREGSERAMMMGGGEGKEGKRGDA